MSLFYDEYWDNCQKGYLGDFSFKWPVIKKFIPTEEGLNILDFGCGIGELAGDIQEINPKSKIFGVDTSEKAIKKARDRFKNLTFYAVQEEQSLPLETGKIDFILAADVIEHIYSTEKTFLEFVRVLRVGGKILITTPYCGFLKNLLVTLFWFDLIFDVCGPHIRFYTKKSLIKILKKFGFKIEKFGYYGRFYPFSKGMYVLAIKL